MDCDSNSIEINEDLSGDEIIGDSNVGELSEIYVSSDASDEMGDGSSKNPYKSLDHAVNNGKNDSTIYLNEGVYTGERNRNIVIDKAITIIGKSNQNTIIDAEFCGRLFNVASNSKLTLINITLLNGFSEENGGLIYNYGGEINIKNCIFKNSIVDGNGGVIYNYLGFLNIENSCFLNNSACDYGGVLYTLGETSIKSSNFTNNALTSNAGVGACIASGGKIDLDGCLFYKCHSPYSAGALLNLGNATINNCRFERLSTDYTAGAISNHNYMVINNSYFGYNDVKYYAAAILAPPSNQHVITEVYNSIFEKNHAGYHGAVSNNYPNTELHMQNCAIINNYIKLNEFYGDISLDDNATIQYCWWGQNEISPYYYSPYNDEKHPEKINASRWLVMKFTSNDGVIYKNEINQLTVSLRYYFDNETKEIYEYDDEFNLPLNVTFYTNQGNLGKKKVVNGVATFDFNPKKGDSVIYAKISNQILKIDNFQLRETNGTDNGSKENNGNNEKEVIKPAKEKEILAPIEKSYASSKGNADIIKADNNRIAKASTNNVPAKYASKITFSGNNYVGHYKSIIGLANSIMKDLMLQNFKKGNSALTFKDIFEMTIKNALLEFKSIVGHIS